MTHESLGSERILVGGAGALGSAFSALLARSGADVWLFARPAQAAAIEGQGGIRLDRAGGGSELVPVHVRSEARELPPPDVLLLLTKGPDSLGALAALDTIRSGLRLAVSLQNGVEKDRVLGDWCGADLVAGGATMVGSTVLAPGHVVLTRLATTFLGELPEGTSPRTLRLGQLLESAGLPVLVTERVLSVEWSKLAEAVPALGLGALTRLPFHRLLLSPEIASLYWALIVEVARVASAAGVELGDWPDISAVRTLSLLPEDEGRSRLHAAGRDLEAKGMTAIRTSMLQDAERGRRLELEPVHGFLVREAERLGVRAEKAQLCYRLLAGMSAFYA